MPFNPKFICCPGGVRRVRENGKWVYRHFPCGEVVSIRRIGPAGRRGTPDSNLFKCEACGTVFRSDGETWREAHGALE